MAHNPKKKPGKKFLGISIGIATGLVVICTAAIIAANIYGGVLDKYLPQGAMHINPLPGSENWDSNYYKNDFNDNAEQTDAAAKKTTLDIASEGITLLKNDGLLPLKTGKTKSTDKKVTLFGRRGTAPIYGGTGSGAGDAGQCTSIIDALKEVGWPLQYVAVVFSGFQIKFRLLLTQFSFFADFVYFSDFVTIHREQSGGSPGMFLNKFNLIWTICTPYFQTVPTLLV